MKKILFVMHSLGYGGAERSLVNLLCEMPPEMFRVDVLLFQRKGALIDQIPDWVNVLDTPDVLRRLYGPVFSAGRLCVTKAIGTLCSRALPRKRKAQYAWRWRHFYSGKIVELAGHYDAAIAYTGAEIMYYVADKVSAEQKIVFIHNDYHTAGYSAEDDAPYFERMDRIISISEQCVEVLRQTFPQDQEKMLYLQNITSSRLVRQKAEAFVPQEYSKGFANIVSIGRLWPQKGFDLAIEAASILRDQGLRFRWFVIGEGALKDTLLKQIRQHDLSEHFVLLSTRSNPYPYIKHCDILVQPSRYEGKSVVLDEAKMLCAPIVATAYPTVGDQVIDGKEGIVVGMTPHEIAEGIKQLLDNQCLRESVQGYLSSHEYGNQAEVEKYLKMLEA